MFLIRQVLFNKKKVDDLPPFLLTDLERKCKFLFITKHIYSNFYIPIFEFINSSPINRKVDSLPF